MIFDLCNPFSGHNYPIWCVAESSTGLYLATGSRDLTAKLWSTDREHSLQTYIGHTQDVDVSVPKELLTLFILSNLMENFLDFRRSHFIRTEII